MSNLCLLLLNNWSPDFQKWISFLKNFAFVNPRNCDFRSTNLDELFARFPSCDQSKVSREYARYIFDKNVDDVFHHCDGNIVKLWKTLSNEGYPELSRIALGILVIAPENASCERAFSIMKFIKNNQCSCLSQLHLDNALRIGLETREPSDFP